MLKFLYGISGSGKIAYSALTNKQTLKVQQICIFIDFLFL